MSKSNFIRGLLVTSALTLLAACSSDGNSGLGSGGGGGISSLSVPQLGVTGDGGATEALGIASLTDGLLGTDGVLGGGSGGEIGGQIPADQLAPISSQLEPVADQIAAALPLDTVTSQIPSLGVNGSDGLVQDLTGMDPLTGIVGSTGLVGTLTGGGNDGQLGDIIPAGTIPSLPGSSGGDPLAALTDLTSGTPLGAVTGALGGGGANPTEMLSELPTTVQTIVGGATADPQATLGIVTGALSDPSALTGVVSQVTGALQQN